MAEGSATKASAEGSPVVAVIVGTRPEAIKMAPVVLALRSSPVLTCRLYSTGQHREMLDPILTFFGLRPDADLDLMRANQTLADLTSLAVARLGELFGRQRPDFVLVQGDTTSAMCAALAAFYADIPVGHVEAGLRTFDNRAPFPEEANRRIIGVLADVHFAPTAMARDHLLAENTPAERIIVTGNTGVDAVLHVMARVRSGLVLPELGFLRHGRRVVLITGHRRESFGAAFRSICLALRDLAQEFQDTDFVYPVHLNPNVQAPVREILGDTALTNVHLIPPMDYVPFVALMGRAALIITDSGGIQEEAPSIGKPVIVTRAVTERPEGVVQGFVELVGTDRRRIYEVARGILSGVRGYAPRGESPYGDGRAAARIVERLEHELARR